MQTDGLFDKLALLGMSTKDIINHLAKSVETGRHHWEGDPSTADVARAVKRFRAESGINACGLSQKKLVSAVMKRLRQQARRRSTNTRKKRIAAYREAWRLEQARERRKKIR